MDKSVTLKGVGQPVVDAGGKGNAVTLTADGIGNTPFNIDSEKDENDDYPLMMLFENYIS